jgi:hypothetical protein
MTKWLLFISCMSLCVITFIGLFIKLPKPFLLIVLPILTITIVVSFFKEEANAEKRELENLEKRS